MKMTSLKVRLALALSLVMLIGAGAAQADERRVWMRFAGALLQNVEQTEVTVDSTTVPGMKNTVHVKAWGNLGRAEVTGFGIEVLTLPPAPDPACPIGSGKLADVVENNLVLTFADLSLLYGEGSGVLCLNFATGEVDVLIDGRWTGGTQRFRGASGDWSLHFDEAVQVGNAASMLAETGMIRGTLVR